jgi:hypothetical protein
MNTALESKRNAVVALLFQILYFKAGPRNVGAPGTPIIWSPLKAIISELFLHRKILVKDFEGA